MKLCRIFFIIYCIPQFIWFLIGSIMIIPSFYLKAFLIYPKSGKTKKILKNDLIGLNEEEKMQKNLKFEKQSSAQKLIMNSPKAAQGKKKKMSLLTKFGFSNTQSPFSKISPKSQLQNSESQNQFCDDLQQVSLTKISSKDRQSLHNFQRKQTFLDAQGNKQEYNVIEDDPDSEYIFILSFEFNYYKFFAWFFIGIPYLLYCVLRDCKQFWELVFKEVEQEDQDQNKLISLVTSKLIEDFQEALDEFKRQGVKTFTVDQFIQLWKIVDKSKLNDKQQFLNIEPEIESEQSETDAIFDTQKREKVIKEYLQHFQNSQTDPNISLVRTQKLLPKMPYYDEEYLTKALHINVPYIRKGIAKYQRKVGNFMFKEQQQNIPGQPTSINQRNSIVSQQNISQNDMTVPVNQEKELIEKIRYALDQVKVKINVRLDKLEEKLITDEDELLKLRQQSVGRKSQLFASQMFGGLAKSPAPKSKGFFS